MNICTKKHFFKGKKSVFKNVLMILCYGQCNVQLFRFSFSGQCLHLCVTHSMHQLFYPEILIIFLVTSSGLCKLHTV